MAAFAERVDFVAVDSAGCGALLKEYGQLLGTAPASEFASRVVDVTELLAAKGPCDEPVPSTRMSCTMPPAICSMRRVSSAAPLAVLRAIRGIQLRELPGADRCCGSAGIYSTAGALTLP